MVTFSTSPNWDFAKVRFKKQLRRFLPKISVLFANEKLLRDIGFLQNHKDFINQNKKGYGLWLWKPIVILHAMDIFPADSIIIYTDIGCEFNFSFRSNSRFNEYVDLAYTKGGLAFELPFLEREWTSLQALEQLNATKSQNRQISGTVIFIKNDTFGRKFVETWYSELIKDSYRSLLDFGEDDLGKGAGTHRHDQSVLSILWHRTGFASVPDETYWNMSSAEKENYPIWATRNRLLTSARRGTVVLTLNRILRKLYVILFELSIGKHNRKGIVKNYFFNKE